MSNPAPCMCGHGPSRHYHPRYASTSTSCRMCNCKMFRIRCTALVYTRAAYPVPPSQCTRRATVGDLCKQHAEAGR